MCVDLCANPCDDDLPKAREFEKQSERMDSSDGIDKGELKSTYCTVPFDLERVLSESISSATSAAPWPLFGTADLPRLTRPLNLSTYVHTHES